MGLLGKFVSSTPWIGRDWARKSLLRTIGVLGTRIRLMLRIISGTPATGWRLPPRPLGFLRSGTDALPLRP